VNPNNKSPSLFKIPVYEVRLVQSRRPLRLAESRVGNSAIAARALHALIGLTDREHFACLFLDGNHNVTGLTSLRLERSTALRALICASFCEPG
jgi:DNA repair protein RadC